MGLLKAILDAIHGEDNLIAGQSFSQLNGALTDTETATITVDSTIRFGEYTDGSGDAQLLINGEIIRASGRTDTTFTTLTRGIDNTEVKLHNDRSIVYDFSKNRSALDLVYRGLLVNFAVGEDLNVIGRNLGVEKCVGLTDDQYRRLIKQIAYGPRTTRISIRDAIREVFDNSLATVEQVINDPYRLRVSVPIQVSTSLDGRFLLNGNELQRAIGTTSVQTNFDINQVLGVYEVTSLSKGGVRDGLTNLFTAGSFTGNVITLGTPTTFTEEEVLIDYGAFDAHYLAPDENTRDGAGRYATLADDTELAECVAEQIVGHGIVVDYNTDPNLTAPSGTPAFPTGAVGHWVGDSAASATSWLGDIGGTLTVPAGSPTLTTDARFNNRQVWKKDVRSTILTGTQAALFTSVPIGSVWATQAFTVAMVLATDENVTNTLDRSLWSARTGHATTSIDSWGGRAFFNTSIGPRMELRGRDGSSNFARRQDTGTPGVGTAAAHVFIWSYDAASRVFKLYRNRFKLQEALITPPSAGTFSGTDFHFGTGNDVTASARRSLISLGEMAVWDRALTDTEALNLYEHWADPSEYSL